MWTWHCHSADPVRGARAQSVRQRRSLDAGYGTDPHPSSVELPCGRAGLRERRPSALARQKVRMPRSSRGCSFVRCVKGRPGPYAERTMAGSRSSPKKMDTRPRRSGRPTHTRCESFAAGGADSSLIGDSRGASRASAAIARSAGLRSCALGTADEIHRTVTGQTSVSFDWRGSAHRDPLRSHERVRSELDRSHRPSMPASSRAGMLLACGSASAGTAPYAISSCQSRHMMTAKRKAANTS